MSLGEGFPPLLGDPGGVKDRNKEANPFARGAKVARSPGSNPEVGMNTGGNVCASDEQEEQGGLGLSLLFTPKSSSGKVHTEQQVAQSDKVIEVRRKVDELYEFIKDKHNVHHKIRALVISLRSGMQAVEREQQAYKKRAEQAEDELKKWKVMTSSVVETPKCPSTRAGKRDRETPGEEEASKKQKEQEDEVSQKVGEYSGWRIVQKKDERKTGQKKEETKTKEQKSQKKKEEKKNEKSRPRRERNKGDALVIEASDKVSYAALLRKVRENPELKELGENVVKTRRTQKGEMLFELKKDPAVKSSSFKELVAKALGSEASVRALSQETVIECRDLDEITTESEVRNALIVQCGMGDVSMAIRLRKAYGGTQTAAIRLPVTAAKTVLEVRSIKVGWSVCSLREIPRVAKQMERCFRCMGFGHQARNCVGPDRSDLCRKCGDKGHIASDCTKPPRCMLCKSEDGNNHMTGGFNCPVYKKAKASQQ